MKAFFTLFLALSVHASFGQNEYELHSTEDGFVPDTIYMATFDIILLTFDTTGHSLVQVPENSWVNEVAAPLIGLSLGEGTPNPGDIHEFSIDSVGTIYYVCQQHPSEKGVIIVGEEFTSVHEHAMPGFGVYPQPASEVLYIDHGGVYSSIRIDDDQGRTIQIVATRRVNAAMDVTALSSGIYFVTLIDDAGRAVARQRFIISR